MTQVLVIQAHPHIENSLSLTVGEAFIDKYRQTHPNDEIITRDLYAADGVPAMNDLTMNAWRKQHMEEPLTDDERTLLQRHDEWLNEFINADKYVFINPMYNHFLPAELKQYLDLTAIAHKTFKYTDHGSVGLLKNKKVIHIQASGDVYHAGGKWATIKFLIKRAFGVKSTGGSSLMDLGDMYLTNMMKFYGIDDIDKLFIEGADAHRDQRQVILDRALVEASTKAINF